jgi:hypothetical protein
MDDRNKGGRPAVPEDAKRTVARMVRLTKEEASELDVARDRVPFARFVREAALEKARQK